MKLSLLPLDLAKWDEGTHDALLLPVFSDERPLRGAAGLADWRLGGRLTRLIKKHQLKGEKGETMMMPPGRRLSFQRVFLFGLGSSSGYGDAELRRDVRWMKDVATSAGASSFALEAPGRATGLIGARRALEIVLDETDKGDGSVLLIDNPFGQKDMAELLRLQGRRD
ncbi:MAG TPA: M17 family peptidase N-terminal domain-containing protein [Kofleriaceae bacterium]|nr:M17 family peptidase N-terminal domain-containing protein [Kofleriaceae bacterium]